MSKGKSGREYNGNSPRVWKERRKDEQKLPERCASFASCEGYLIQDVLSAVPDDYSQSCPAQP